MTSNLYKVGDWVYCELSPFQPYVVRKIEELTKTPCGNVEAKVICSYRYQDIPTSVMATVEKYQSKNKENNNENKPAVESAAAAVVGSDAANATTTTTTPGATTTTDPPKTTTTAPGNDYYEEAEVADLNEQQRYNLRHREMFFSKCTDTIAATAIRAKCSVLLFNEEIEKYSEYLAKEDQFYYHLTYDPYQKSLVADKGEIRVGTKYQAEVPHLKVQTGPNGTVVVADNDDVATSHSQSSAGNDRVLRSQLQRNQSQIVEIPISQQTEEILQWCPLGCTLSSFRNQLSDADIDKFLMIAKSIGTFARALDCNNAYKQPSLPLSAAAASREVTLFHAMNTLHDCNYDIGKAVLSLITPSGPVLCKDEMEDWSAAEANLFEDAIEKYGKDFNEIRKDYLPWKSMKSLVEYYYTWKTTDRYLQQKRIKLTEQESKLKQVYIPNHSKQNQSAMIKSSHVQFFNQYDVHLKNSCESCGTPNTSTNQWYAYNPTSLVQLIMSGNQNPNALANAHAQVVANLQNANPNNPNAGHVYQARLCADCWSYWKRFALFKYPNARQERLNQLKNQVHKCSVNGCGREFKLKQLLIKHCGIAHGYFAKANPPPGQNNTRFPAIRNRTAFHLLTTPMTKAARLICNQTIKLTKLARKPFKLVDLSELNKEWFKETRNIGQLLEVRQAKLKEKPVSVKKLDVKLINGIHKNRAKLLKKLKPNAGGSRGLNGNSGHAGTNGHSDENNGEAAADNNMAEEDEQEAADDDETDSDHLVIDNETDKPDFLKYFEAKCQTPSYVPEKLYFPKPSADQINKFHLNLITMNRKRPLDQTAAGANQDGGNVNSKGQNGQQAGSLNDVNDSIPLSKKSLLNQNQAAHLNNDKAKAVAAASNNVVGGNNKPQQQGQQQQQLRLPQKSNKPTQSINLPNSPEDIYYMAIPTIK